MNVVVVVVEVDVALVEKEVEVVVTVVESAVVAVGLYDVLVVIEGVVIVATPMLPAAGEYDETIPTTDSSMTTISVSCLLLFKSLNLLTS